MYFPFPSSVFRGQNQIDFCMVTGERHVSLNGVMKPLHMQHNNLSSFQMSTTSHADTWNAEASKRKKIIVIRNTASASHLTTLDKKKIKKKKADLSEKVKIQ